WGGIRSALRHRLLSRLDRRPARAGEAGEVHRKSRGLLLLSRRKCRHDLRAASAGRLRDAFEEAAAVLSESIGRGGDAGADRLSVSYVGSELRRRSFVADQGAAEIDAC